MTREKVLKFINENPLFFLATQDAEQPRVRAMMMLVANENGILFNTNKTKDVYRQFCINPLVELCFYSTTDKVQIRIVGKVKVLENLEMKKRVVEILPFLKSTVNKEGYDNIAPCRLLEAKAVMWTMETNRAQKKYIDLYDF